MSDFKLFRSKLQERITQMVSNKDKKELFVADIDPYKLWDLYLDSFPAGTNEIFRVRREFDCSCCRSFIKNAGGIVVINSNNEIETIWDYDFESEKYQPVADALSAYVKSCGIKGYFVADVAQFGTEFNHETLEDGTIIRWEHFRAKLPDRFLTRGRGETLPSIASRLNTGKQTLMRALEELSLESVKIVNELIAQGSLYRGEEWKGSLREFETLKEEYDKLTSGKNEFAWKNAAVAGSLAGIRNSSIGTLLENLSDGMELEAAVGKYEYIVAGPNFKRPKPLFSIRQLNEQKEKLIAEGYGDSLERRYATLDDISVNDILYYNGDSAKRISGGIDGLFDDMAGMSKTNGKAKKFDRTEEISIEDFLKNVLPTATEIEAFVENKHAKNMVSLIAPVNKGSKSMFKWNNGFCWAYSGNIADSMIRQRVEKAGGNIHAALRFSLQWNDLDYDENDLDAHCIAPGSFYEEHIYYARADGHDSKGNLDVDNRHPREGEVAVENIAFPDKNSMKPGIYKMFVKNYAFRGGKKGFRAEVEFNGTIFSFDYPHALKQDESVTVAEVELTRNGEFILHNKLDCAQNYHEVWGVKAGEFVPVSVVMTSPNYWESAKQTGNKHYMFMLKGCVNNECPNGFFNEYIKPEIMLHKGVFEALGNKLAVEKADDQLSGLGFSETIRNELVVKVKGHTERVLKIKF